MGGIGQGDGGQRAGKSEMTPSGDLRPNTEAGTYSHGAKTSPGEAAPVRQRVSQNTSAPPPQAPITSLGMRKGAMTGSQSVKKSESISNPDNLKGAGTETSEDKRDIRSLAQSIVEEEALGVTAVSGHIMKPKSGVDWLNGHRIHLSLLVMAISALVVLVPAWIEQGQRQRATDLQRVLQTEATQFAEAIGPAELSQQLRERQLDEVRRVYRLRQEGIVNRIRAAGIPMKQSDLSIRPDFENDGLLLAALLDQGGDKGTIAIWATTHGKSFGRPLPTSDLGAILQADSARLAAVIQTLGMTLLGIWIIPPLLRRRSDS